MSIDLSDNNPRVEYSVAQGVTQTSFAIPFEFFDDSDVNIYVDGVLKAEGVDYTLTGGDGSTGSASLSVTGATGGSTVIIVRRIALERVTDFTAGADINRAALNQQLDSLVAIAADLDDRIDRSIHLPDEDPTDITFELPVQSLRANKYLAFGATGDVTLTTGTTSSIVVSSFAETFIDDNSGAEVLNSLGVTSTPAELNKLDGVTLTLTDYNTLTASAAELNLLDGKSLSGADAEIITGTAGTAGHIVQWNADGDLVSYGAATQLQATWEAGVGTTESLISPAKVKAAIDALQYKPFAEAYVTYSGVTPTMVAEYGMATVSRPGAGDTAFVFDVTQLDTNYVIESHMQLVLDTTDLRYQYWVLAKSTTGFIVRWRFATLAAADLPISVVCKRLV